MYFISKSLRAVDVKLDDGMLRFHSLRLASYFDGTLEPILESIE